MPEAVSGARLFLNQARQNFLHTGAIAPSSRYVARAIVSAIRPDGDPIDVLEAGAGTGALTREILKRIPFGSRLDLYEINPVFTRHLENAFADPGRVRVKNKRVEDIPAGKRYDAIISAP